MTNSRGRPTRARELAGGAVVASLLLAALFAFSACGGDATSTTAPIPAQTASVDLYAERCARCHGATGTGLLGPDLTSRSQKVSEDIIAAQIAEGGGSMPGFQAQLSDEQISALASWIKAGMPGL